MFDDAPHGERLAWICLLCFAKAQGRAGKVRLRDKVFAERFRLTAQAVEGMLARAIAGPEPAVIRQGDVITVLNWKEYQDPKVRSKSLEDQQLTSKRKHFSKTSENDATTNHTTTNHTTIPPALEEVSAYCRERSNGIDPEEFIAHYEANGWVQGKGRKPIRSWKAAMVTWEKNRREEKCEALDTEQLRSWKPSQQN